MLSAGLTTESIPLRRAVVGPLIVLGTAWLSAIFFK
jgi:hypothetical protein